MAAMPVATISEGSMSTTLYLPSLFMALLDFFDQWNKQLVLDVGVLHEVVVYVVYLAKDLKPQLRCIVLVKVFDDPKEPCGEASIEYKIGAF